MLRRLSHGVGGQWPRPTPLLGTRESPTHSAQDACSSWERGTFQSPAVSGGASGVLVGGRYHLWLSNHIDARLGGGMGVLTPSLLRSCVEGVLDTLLSLSECSELTLQT